MWGTYSEIIVDQMKTEGRGEITSDRQAFIEVAILLEASCFK